MIAVASVVLFIAIKAAPGRALSEDDAAVMSFWSVYGPFRAGEILS